MKSASIKSLDKTIAARQAEVAKTRDKLEAAISEWEELRDNCEEAWALLQDARDALSRLV